MHERLEPPQTSPRPVTVDPIAIGLLVLAIIAVIAGLLWVVAGGGALAQAVFIGGAAIATVPLSLRVLLRWGTPRSGGSGGLLGALLIPSVVAAVAAAITIAITLATPAGQTFSVRAQQDAQSWFYENDAIAAQITITTLLPVLGGLGLGVAALLVVGLPWLAIRSPHAAAADSSIEHAGAERSPLIVRLVFIGMAPLMVGIGLWVAADEPLTAFPRSLGWVLGALARGYSPSWDDVQLVLGVLLVAIGTASVVTGIVLMLRARPNDQR